VLDGVERFLLDGRLWATALLALSCTGPNRTEVQGGGAKPDASLSFEPVGGDVWAWQVHVHGATDGPDLARCAVRANGGWTTAETRDREWRAEVPLAPGRNALVAECRDRSGTLRRTREVRFDAKLADVPRAVIVTTRTEGATVLDASASRPSERGSVPLSDFSWAEDVDARGAAQPLGTGSRLVLGDSRGDQPRTVRLTVRDSSGHADEAAVLVSAAGGGARGRPTWIDEAIVYGVVLGLSGNPPLEAVRQSLPELADLGVNVLWLSPIFESPPADFGYAVTDYFVVRPAYGTEGDLEALLAEAHRLGMRVLLDFVPNHTSSRHRYFEEAAALGARSRYFDFYARGRSGEPTHYFDWLDLPNLNYDSGEVRQWMFQATDHWLRRFRIDGFRVDAAWGIRQRAPDFLGRWVDEVRRINPDTLLIAEASARDPFYFESGFDAAYDWTEEVGKWAWEGLFDHPDTLAQRLEQELSASEAGVAEVTPAPRVLRFLDNNDTGERFLSRHGHGVTRAASALLLTLPGLPCLFSGEETGAEYEPYRASGPIAPGGDADLRAWYRTLVWLRRSHPSLYRGERVPVATSPGSRVISYVRHDAASGEAVLVALNFDGNAKRARLELPAEFASAAPLDDLLIDKTYGAVRGVVRIDLPAWGVTVARLRPTASRRHIQQTVVAPVP
jgi:cyclomaltodextrinase / maltogenic alpha-amylase / neopullulanase